MKWIFKKGDIVGRKNGYKKVITGRFQHVNGDYVYSAKSLKWDVEQRFEKNFFEKDHFILVGTD